MEPRRENRFGVSILFWLVVLIWLLGFPGCGDDKEAPGDPPPCNLSQAVEFYPCPIFRDHGFCGWLDGDRYYYKQSRCWIPDGRICETECSL